jgi:hypothetical protein
MDWWTESTTVGSMAHRIVDLSGPSIMIWTVEIRPNERVCLVLIWIVETATDG